MNTKLKTISLRIDEATSEKLETVKKYLSEDHPYEISLSDSIRYCIEMTEKNFFNDSLRFDNLLQIIKSYLTAAYLSGEGIINFDNLDRFHGHIEKLYEEHSIEEIEEVGLLYNTEEPISFARLLRFKNRLMPSIFLTCMGIKNKQYKNLNDDELADFISQQFLEDEFKNKAVELFRIKI